jgi:hypothetical protein
MIGAFGVEMEALNTTPARHECVLHMVFLEDVHRFRVNGNIRDWILPLRMKIPSWFNSDCVSLQRSQS